MSSAKDSKPEPGEDIGLSETVHPAASGKLPTAAAAASAGHEDTALATSDTLASAASDHLGDRPDSDKLVRAVARAKIASQLFQKKEQVKLGRYHLLEMIGAGGMGVVWGAWDPELDRLVAIKLVKAEMQGVRDRILLEGQALAKVSHPNIVPVFDVGVVDEQVYLVMEWVRGKNLRAYCKTPRSVKEILAVYRSAAEGLIAAHAAGIIHRDFKPDNAIRGDDGRVRILDFGLARGEVRPPGSDARTPSTPGDSKSFSTPSSDLTRGAGTPRYMPPEQAEGKALTPAVDQYAFCVSLREALVERTADDKKAEVPKWIDDILTKGTAREASNRYASMSELVAALDNDPAKVRRRRLLGAGGVAVAGATFAIGMFAGGGDSSVERCAGGKDEIARSWNASVRDKLQAHLKTLGPYGISEATRLAGTLEDYTNKWAVAHRDACLTKERGELTAQLYERNLGCLSRARVALDTIVDVLSRSTTEQVSNVVATVNALPDSGRCITETQTSTLEPPSAAIAEQADALANDIERARVLAHAQVPEAIPTAADAVKRAVALGYPPLIARGHLVHGIGLGLQTRSILAVEALDHATRVSLATGDDRTAIEAFARLIALVAKTEPKELPADMQDVFGSIRIMEAIANRESTVPPFERYLFMNNVGAARLARGDAESARAWWLRARAERDRVTSKELELNLVWGNLALVTREPREQLALGQREVQALEHETGLGSDHPNVIEARLKTAVLEQAPGAAFMALSNSCKRLLEMHPHLGERIVYCAFEAGWLANELDDLASVREWMTRVAALALPKDVTSIEQQLAPAFAMYADGKHELALREARRIGDTLARSEHVYSQYHAVNALLLAARSARHSSPTLVQPLLQQAHDIVKKLSFLQTTTFTRRKHRVAALLAAELIKDDPESAKRLANEALAWYRNVRGYEERVRELEAITGSR